MTQPLLVDLFCNAGGASLGYERAGFRVVGVDLHPQRNYPFGFRQGDAINLMGRLLAYTEWLGGLLLEHLN